MVRAENLSKKAYKDDPRWAKAVFKNFGKRRPTEIRWYKVKIRR